MTPAPSDSPTAPTYLGMVICDNILQDPATKKYFLLGTASVTYAGSFPAQYQKLCVYAVLTGIRAGTEITLRLVRVDPTSPDDEEILTIDRKVTAADPLAVAEVTLALRRLMFPRAGEYRFQLWSAGTFLGERKFEVRQKTAGRTRTQD